MGLEVGMSPFTSHPPTIQGLLAIPGEGRGFWLPLKREEWATSSLGHLPQAQPSPPGGVLSRMPQYPFHLG